MKTKKVVFQNFCLISKGHQSTKLSFSLSVHPQVIFLNHRLRQGQFSFIWSKKKSLDPEVPLSYKVSDSSVDDVIANSLST